MNRKSLYILLLTVLGLSSCNFLDKNPDNRTEIDSKKKVRLLLVDAYNAPNYGPLCECSSDNIIDNNTPDAADMVHTKQPFNQGYNQIFAWEDVTAFSSQDSPYYLWQFLYRNIAVANQALDAIGKLEAKGENMDAERGEALICRAYNHFILVNIFAQAYKDDELSANDMGVHYMTEPETEVKPKYERDDVAKVYSLIEQDLEEALPLVSDEYYTVPKYHFNVKAAYAFAARFYLFKRDYDKVIEYANKVLGTTAAEAQILMFDAANCKSLGNIETELLAWVDAVSPSNLMIQTTGSFAMYSYLDNCRYSFNRDPLEYTVGRYSGGSTFAWSGTFPGASQWHIDADYGSFFSKLYERFEYEDKVAGIGYPHSIRREFTTGETLLCRAEAKIMKGDLSGATADMNVWCKGYLATKTLTESGIKNTFPKNYKNVQRTPELHNADMCPSWVISEDKLPYVWCVLYLRRIETLHDGMRWFDIKRYGIEITHEIGYPVVTKTLVWNDDRRAIQLPQEVILGGQTKNPRVIVGDNYALSDFSGSISEPNGLQLYLELQNKTFTKDTATINNLY